MKEKLKNIVGAGDSARPQKRNTQKGITLVALVITIIVLLILAMVSISIVMNQGIMTKSKNAVDTHKIAAEKEAIQIGYSKYLTEKYNGETATLEVADAKVQESENEWTITFNKTNDVYKLSKNGGEPYGPIAGDNAGDNQQPSEENTNPPENNTTEPEETPEDDDPTGEKITSKKINKVLSETENTKLKDEYGNTVVVPAGFKIKVEPDTNNATHVTEGIVVTDGTNEFVWIPVGKIYTDVAKTEENSKTITLGRYSDFTVGASPVQTLANYSEKVQIEDATEDTSANHDSEYKNTIAKDIKAFLESANNNGGYYLGRYEARTSTERTASENALTTVTENKNDYVYNYVTQPQASERCQNMYTGKPFTSDLTNSYAYDTALMFIQNFSGNSNYAQTTSAYNWANKGTDLDKISNIYDMSGNYFEWSTESGFDSDNDAVFRGMAEDLKRCSCGRFCYRTVGSSVYGCSFRPILYV